MIYLTFFALSGAFFYRDQDLNGLLSNLTQDFCSVPNAAVKVSS